MVLSRFELSARCLGLAQSGSNILAQHACSHAIVALMLFGCMVASKNIMLYLASANLMHIPIFKLLGC